jgi:hypothetical protein
MDLKNNVQTLLQKKMDRRDFIKHVGIGFVALIGLSAIVRSMNATGGQKVEGYSTGVYGGNATSSQSRKTG